MADHARAGRPRRPRRARRSTWSASSTDNSTFATSTGPCRASTRESVEGTASSTSFLLAIATSPATPTASVLETGGARASRRSTPTERAFTSGTCASGPSDSKAEIIGLIVITSDVTEQRREQADRDRFFSLSLDMLVVVSPNGYFRRREPGLRGHARLRPERALREALRRLRSPRRSRALRARSSRPLRGNRVTDFENRYRHRTASTACSPGARRSIPSPATSTPSHETSRPTEGPRPSFGRLRKWKPSVSSPAASLTTSTTSSSPSSRTWSSPEPPCLGRSTPPIASARSKPRGQRAVALTNQLLAFSRRQPFRPIAVDLNKLIRDLMKMLRRLIPANISIDLILGGPADRGQRGSHTARTQSSSTFASTRATRWSAAGG